MINIVQKTDKEVLKKHGVSEDGKTQIHTCWWSVGGTTFFAESENTNENPLKLFLLFKLPIILPGVYFRKYTDKYAKICSKMLIIMSKEKQNSN